MLLVGVTYARTLLPGLHEFGDVTKAQFLGRVLGTTHPTGYPLYILLTAPVAWLPLGSLAGRVNAFSALMGLGAVVLTYLLLRRLRVRPALASVCALAFAWSKVTWEQFVVAEVYALGACLVALVLYLLAASLTTGRRAWFLAAAAAYALSFGNHLTVVTLLPAFALATLLGAWRTWPPWSTTAWIVLFIALGMAQYGYLFWATARGSLYLEYRVHTWADFVDYVSGAHYRGRMFAFGLEPIWTHRIPRFARLVFRDLGWMSLLAPWGCLSVWWPAGRRAADPSVRRVTAVLLLAALGQLFWLVSYDIPDIDVYAIPLLLIVSLFAGVGAEAALRFVTELSTRVKSADSRPALARVPRGVWTAVGTLAMAALVVPAGFHHAPSHARAKAFSRRIEGELETLGQGAIVVGAIHYGPRMALIERLYAEGLSETRDLHLAAMAKPADVRKYLRGKGTLRDSSSKERLRPGRRVFLHERGAGMDFGPEVRKVRRGHLWEVLPKRKGAASSLR